MTIYRCKIIGNTKGIYISHLNCETLLDDDAIKSCENYRNIPANANSLVITRLYDPHKKQADKHGYIMRIVQASGYSPDRGLFCDYL